MMIMTIVRNNGSDESLLRSIIVMNHYDSDSSDGWLATNDSDSSDEWLAMIMMNNKWWTMIAMMSNESDDE